MPRASRVECPLADGVYEAQRFSLHTTRHNGQREMDSRARTYVGGERLCAQAGRTPKNAPNALPRHTEANQGNATAIGIGLVRIGKLEDAPPPSRNVTRHRVGRRCVLKLGTRVERNRDS